MYDVLYLAPPAVIVASVSYAIINQYREKEYREPVCKDLLNNVITFDFNAGKITYLFLYASIRSIKRLKSEECPVLNPTCLPVLLSKPLFKVSSRIFGRLK